MLCCGSGFLPTGTAMLAEWAGPCTASPGCSSGLAARYGLNVVSDLESELWLVLC